MNSSRREIVRENNGILKTTTSESYSKGVNDTEREDRSIWEHKEDTITKITSVDQLDKMYPPRDECEESKREIKNPGKIDNVAMSGKRMRQRPFCDIVDNREQRREELEKMEGDLQKRLDILECSMPAVMVWNILKMSQGAPVCSIGRILEKQFKHTRELSCRSTPSCHYDCRVREVEAERKLALKKTEEARTLWSEKLATLEKRKRELEEARRIQEEQKNAIERLNEEAKALREAIEKKTMEVDEPCQYGECGDIQCKQRWLSEVSSVTSIESEDIQCLEKLQQLAEEEVIIKRGITELERREEAYMRTLQQADELWSKMEGDGISMTSALQEQLNTKIAANQQLADRVCELEDALEKCQAKLAVCRTELEKFLSIEKIEATIGRNDDVAQVTDKAVTVRAKVVHRPIGRVDDVATVEDGEVLARVKVADEEALARVEVADKEALAKVEAVDEEALVKVEAVDKEALAKIEAVDEKALTIVEVMDEETLARIALIDADVDVALVGDDKYVSVKPDLADLAIDRPADLVQIEDAKRVEVADEEALAKVEVVDEEALVKVEAVDKEALAKIEAVDEKALTIVEVIDEETLARIALIDADVDVALVGDDKYVSVKPDLADLAIDRPADLVQIEDAESIVRPEDITYEQLEAEKVREYLAKLGSLEELYKDGEPCAPEFVCNDVVTSPTGMTDEELMALGMDPKKLDEKLIAREEERDRQFPEELAKDVVEDIEKKEKKADEISVEIETRPLIKAKEEIAEAIDVPVRKIVTRQMIREEVVDDKPVTIPVDVRALEVEKIKTDQAIVIQRDTILSWIDMIDTIRTSAAKHPDCHTVKKDADVLIEQVGAHVGIKPKKVEEEKIIIITEDKREKVIEENEIKIKKRVIIETKLPEISQANKVKESAAFEDLTDKELAIEKVIKDKIMDSAEEEKTLIDQKIEKEEEEIIPEHVKIDEKEIEDIPIKEAVIEKEEAVAEKIRVDERLLVSEEIDESKYVEVDEIIPEIVSPTVDLIKIEKIERGELLITDAEEVPISDIISEKITVEEPPPSVDAKEEPSITDIIQKEIKIEEEPITDIREIIEEKKPIEEIITEKKIEIPPVTERIIQEEIEEVIPEKKIEIPPVTERIIQEEIEEIIPEKKIEISPVTKRIIQEKIEEIKEIETTKPPVPEAEIKKEEDKKEIKEMPKEVTPPFKLFEEIEKEEIPSVEKEEISAKIAISTKQEKKLELVEIELKIPIADIKPAEIEVPVIPIDPRLLTQPYLIIAKIKEKELSQIAPAMKLPCAECCLQPPPAETAEIVKIMQTNVAQTEIVQTKVVDNEIIETEIVETEVVETEFVEITTQTISAAEPPRMPSIPVISEYLKPAEIKAPSTEIAGDRPEITGRKMPSYKRLKDQSTVTTVSAGSQTDKTSHVSHDRVVRDERERARVTTDELLRSIKIAAGLARPDAEREIRTINYGGRSDEMGKVACNCCQCGKISTPPSTRPRLKARPQTDAAKTAMPPAVAAAFKRIFIPPKIDRPISYDRLCPDCIARIQGRMSREKYHIEKISRDQGSCGCASSIDKSCRAVPRKREIEKKDQGCLAKMPKRKTNLVEHKRKDDLQSILEAPEKIDVEPLSPSCICYKSGKTSVQPIRKGNCYCGD